MSIYFFSEGIPFRLKKKPIIKKWIALVARKEQRSIAEVNYIFCSDKYLLEVNKKYLKHNYFTDIITFQYEAEDSQVSGDIFISIDRVKENAKEYQVTFDRELKRVMIHGVLHLLGYKDKNKAAKKQMTQKEDFYLNLLGKQKPGK